MKESLVVGGVVVAAAAAIGLYAYNEFNKGRHHGFYGTAGSKIQHRPSANDAIYAARLARRPGNPIKDSGITNVGQYDSGGVGWRGWRASPWSPLTERNYNYTYSRTPTNRLLRPSGAGHIPHMRCQGATGLTRYLPGIQYTYW